MNKLPASIYMLLIIVFVNFAACAQPKGEVVDEYTKVITGRADKIVSSMTFDSEDIKIKVRDIIVDHYRFLNDAEEARDADIAKIREEYAENKELRNAKLIFVN